MASRMDVPVRLHIPIQTIRLISDRGREKRGGDGGRRSGARGIVGIDGSIVLGNGNVTGIGKETATESGTERGRGRGRGNGNGTRGRCASRVGTGIGTTVVRGSIDGETTNDAVRLLSPMDLHLHRRRLTRTGKKASKWPCHVPFLFCLMVGFFFPTRISPRASPRPPSRTPSDRRRVEPPQVEPSQPTPPKPKHKPEFELELEMDAGTSEEASRAARRARRQAILAKYTGIASNMQSVSPSPGPPSSAVQPPQPVSSISDLPSQPHSAVDAPVIPGESVTRMRNGSTSRWICICCEISSDGSSFPR